MNDVDMHVSTWINIIMLNEKPKLQNDMQTGSPTDIRYLQGERERQCNQGVWSAKGTIMLSVILYFSQKGKTLHLPLDITLTLGQSHGSLY